ncbi:MAG: NAD-dependent epimerase/dehydratase family protein [Thermoflavifilum sp.]|nr:NAD-dependent epimerase/dehydratase family protein [Thermoflavifilum sp.]
MANIFISGGTGFIGQYVVQQLVQQGHRLHVLTRQHKQSQHPAIEYFPGDITSYESVNRAMRGCELAYHLAGYARAWHCRRDYYWQVNAEGTRHILEAAIAQGLRRVCVVSTAGILPPSIDGKPITEEAPLRPELHTLYESSKWQGEQIARSYLSQIEVVIAYPTKVFGPGPIDESNSATLMMRDYLLGKWHVIPGNGKGVMDYVYVADVAQGIQLVMQRGRAGEAYLLGGEAVSYDDFFEQIAQLSGVRNKLFHLPVAGIYAFSYVQWLKSQFGYKPLLTPEWVRKIPYNWIKSSDKARRELGYAPRSFCEGLSLTLHWLLEDLQILA